MTACFAMLNMYMAAAGAVSSSPHQLTPLICTSMPSARTNWEPCSCKGGRGPPVYRSYSSAVECEPTRAAKLTARATCGKAAPGKSAAFTEQQVFCHPLHAPTAVGCLQGRASSGGCQWSSASLLAA
jgi:hypothetical protein